MMKERSGHAVFIPLHRAVALFSDPNGLFRGKHNKKVESASANTNFQAIKAYCRDLTEQARKLDSGHHLVEQTEELDIVIDRSEEISRLVDILSCGTWNPVLVGEPGIGKIAVVEGLARRIVRGDVPSSLSNVRLLALDMDALVAGAKYRGEFKKRLEAVLKELKNAEGKVILFIDRIHLVLGRRRTEGSVNAANLFKPMLARGQLRCIGATTREEYDKFLENDTAFNRRFQEMHVKESTMADTETILRRLEKKYKLEDHKEKHKGPRRVNIADVVSLKCFYHWRNRKESARDINFRALKTYGQDLVKEAGKLDPVIGRDKEIEQVIQILFSLYTNNALLIGESDVGKTAVIEGLAQRIARGDVPDSLSDVRLVALDVGALMAGTRYGGTFQGRLMAALKEAEDAEGKVILFIDRIHLMLGTWIAGVFKYMLGRTQLRCIVTMTSEEYRKYVEMDAAFARRFRQVYVAEPNVALQLSSRYITGRHLPDKEIDLVDKKEKDKSGKARLAVIRKELDDLRGKRIIQRLEGEASENLMLTETETVGPDQIAEVVSQWTDIPVTRLGHNEKRRLIDLAEHLHKRVVGQEQAVDAVANVVLGSRVGLGQPQKPTGSFLFLGSIGVGKTELAKALAEQLFDDENLVVRIDMSEYIEQQSVSRLIGEPVAYVGHEKGEQLTEAVRRRPYSVVLFDGVEKAHVSVFNRLLQVLDDGRLTDGQGRIVDFTNSVIIMTSNIGAEHLLAGMVGESSMQIARDRVMQEVRDYFMPELLNRLDDIVIFNPLSHDQLRKVARLQMKDVALRMAERGVAMAVSEAALDIVLAESYNPIYGARPIKRWLQKRLVAQMAIMLIKEEIVENSTVYIDALPGKKELSYRIEKDCALVNPSTCSEHVVFLG